MRPRRLRRPAWVAVIHDALPAVGSAEVILTSGGTVRYLQLSREVLDSAMSEAERREDRLQRRSRRVADLRRGKHRQAVRGLLLVVVIALVATAWLWMERLYVQHEHDRLWRMLSVDSLLPATHRDDRSTVSLLHPVIDRLRTLTQKTVTERQELEARDAAVRAYVEATRHLIDSDNKAVVARLAEAGLSQRKLLSSSLLPVSLSKGGAHQESALMKSMRSMLDQSHQEALVRNGELRSFVGALPSVAPLRDMRATSTFGLRHHPLLGSLEHHTGTDFVSATDQTVRSSMAGTVIHAGRHGDYGLTVIVRNEFGVETLYAHLSKVAVQVGTLIKPGTTIGQVGSTGMSSGPHLHYEVRYDQVFLDPSKILALTHDVLEQIKR